VVAKNKEKNINMPTYYEIQQTNKQKRKQRKSEKVKSSWQEIDYRL